MAHDGVTLAWVLYIAAYTATGACVVLGLGVTVPYILKQGVGWFATLVGACAVVAAVLAAGAGVRYAAQETENRLKKVVVTDVVDSFEHVQATTEIAGEALDPAGRAAFLAPLDAPRAAVDTIAASLWGVRRAGAWDENRLLDALESELPDLKRWRARLEAGLDRLECTVLVTPADADWPELVRNAWDHHVRMLAALGGRFAGIDWTSTHPSYVSQGYAVLRALAGPVAGTGAVLLVSACLVAYRRRALARSDVFVLACGGVVLAAALLMFGTGRSDAGTLAERSFQETAKAYRAALKTENALLAQTTRIAAVQVTVPFADFAADHRAHYEGVDRLVELIADWRQAPGDDARAERVYAQLMKTFRDHAGLGSRLERFRCAVPAAQGGDALGRYRSLWNPYPGSRHPIEAMVDAL